VTPRDTPPEWEFTAAGQKTGSRLPNLLPSSSQSFQTEVLEVFVTATKNGAECGIEQHVPCGTKNFKSQLCPSCPFRNSSNPLETKEDKGKYRSALSSILGQFLKNSLAIYYQAEPPRWYPHRLILPQWVGTLLSGLRAAPMREAGRSKRLTPARSAAAANRVLTCCGGRTVTSFVSS